MQKKHSRSWLLPNLWMILMSMVNSQYNPQPCPENPIVLTGSDFGQYVYSPYDVHHKYPANTDCRFILVAKTLQRRIHITVLESQLEEPLFTDCKDYVSVRDGALPTSQEIIRWCGSFYPPSLTSSGDSLYIHFHSDNIIQSRGFNLSFVDFDLPGCPPNWIYDGQSTYCYKLFDPVHEYTFMDAQKLCFYERSNLLTFESSDEYDFVKNQYVGSQTLPWIGYNDANKEGVFDAIDPNIKSWPETFPTSKTDHNDKDCVYLDWNVREGTAHTVDDCRNRHPLICKKRQDGTTVPIQLSTNLIRYGFQTSSFNWIILLIVLIFLILILIILWIIYQKCKRRNTVEVVNERQPTQADTNRSVKTNTTSNKASSSAVTSSKNRASSTDAVKKITEINAQRTTSAAQIALQKTINEDESRSLNDTGNNVNTRSPHHNYNGSNSPRIHTKPNQQIPSDPEIQDSSSETQLQLDQIDNVNLNTVDINDGNGGSEADLQNPNPEQPPDRSHLYMEANAIKVVSSIPDQRINGPTQLHTGLAPVGEPNISREPTHATGFSSTRSRTTHPTSQQTFERPHVGTLDNISAISLDEFWQK